MKTIVKLGNPVKELIDRRVRTMRWTLGDLTFDTVTGVTGKVWGPIFTTVQDCVEIINSEIIYEVNDTIVKTYDDYLQR